MLPLKIERSRRVKRMYLLFDCPEYITLKLPVRYSERSGLRFIQEHADWICRTMESQPRVHRLHPYLVLQPRLSFGGYWHRLELQFQRGTYGYVVDKHERTVRVAINPGSSPEPQLGEILRSIAREHLPSRVETLSRKSGIKFHGVTVRDQKSRWGSCSETGGISLNWRLVLIPPKLQDHIILHELVHIRHFDHSRAFHTCLRRLDLRTEENVARLSNISAQVFALGRIRD
jgi:predicted metal-dependent hydrolase